MENESRDEIQRKKQKEMLEIKNTETEIKNVFDGLISRMDMTEENICELEDIIEISKTKNQRVKNKTKYYLRTGGKL